MHLLFTALGWLAAAVFCLVRWSCRYRYVDDPRPGILAGGETYLYALLHAHQLAGVMIEDRLPLATMASRSRDGDLIVPALVTRGLIPTRGSSRSGGRDKGGRAALAEMEALLRRGIPGCLTVDGPRGPRGRVHRGIVELAVATGVPVLPIVVIPARRWILTGTWDRLQIPRPFTTVSVTFGEPLRFAAGADVHQGCERVALALAALERRCDAVEAELAAEATRARAARRSGLEAQLG